MHSRRGSNNDLRAAVDTVANAQSPQMRPRENSMLREFDLFPSQTLPAAARIQGADSVSRELDFMNIKRNEEVLAQINESVAPSQQQQQLTKFQETVLTKLEEIMARLESLEMAANHRVGHGEENGASYDI